MIHVHLPCNIPIDPALTPHDTHTNPTGCGHGSEAETSLEDLTDHSEEWEFSCRCGEHCNSADTPSDAWPQGALFQCKGAWMCGCIYLMVDGGATYHHLLLPPRVLTFAFNHTNPPGCETWAHAQCLYGKDRAPRLAFCYDCHDTLRALAAADRQAEQAGGKPLPPVHTGRQIRLRSRVIVCRGPRGLEEGVVTMFGEGNARVHFKVRACVLMLCM